MVGRLERRLLASYALFPGLQSVPQAIHDLLPVVYAAEENGEDSDFGRPIIDLEVEDEILVGHGANARLNFCLFRAPVRMRDKSAQVGKSVVDPSRRALDSAFEVLSEFLVGLDEMLLDEVEVACDIRRAADAIASHACA